jgi:hypothetical protein
MRIGEEVGIAVDDELAVVEHDRVDVELGRIGALLGANVPDIVGVDVHGREAQGLERALVDIGHFPIDELELVDLQRVDGLEGLLPPALSDRRLLLGLFAELLEVHVELRVVEAEVGNGLEPDHLSPLGAGGELGDVDHRRIGMRVLGEYDVGQRERGADRMEAQLLDLHGIAVEALVHPTLDKPAHRLVDEEGRDEREDDHGKQAEPDPAHRLAGERPRPVPGSLSGEFVRGAH